RRDGRHLRGDRARLRPSRRRVRRARPDQPGAHAMMVRRLSRPGAGPCSILLALAVAACSRAAGGYEARGTVELPEVDVSAMQSARVVAIRVDAGDVVRAGDTLRLLIQTDRHGSRAGQRARLATALA